MKKLLAMAMMAVMMLTFAGCGNSTGADDVQPAAQGVSTGGMEILERGSSEAVRNSVSVTEAVSGASSEAKQQTEAATTQPVKTAAKSLVVYFSWSGNTEKVAQEIQKQTGADIFRIVPSTPYTDNYNELLNVAQQEKKSNARPQIAGNVPDFEQYDTIYFGYPNWWSDMPMIMYTFLDNYDMSGKTIAPFVTSGGSGFSGTINEIKKSEPSAKVVDGLSLGSSEAANCSGAVASWLGKIK